MANCPCCGPPWATAAIPVGEPCGMNVPGGIISDMPCGFEIDYSGVGSQLTDTTLYPTFGVYINHRLIQNWQSDQHAKTWIRNWNYDVHADEVEFGGSTWFPAAMRFYLVPEWTGTQMNWDLFLYVREFGGSTDKTVCKWELDDWRPYDTQASGAFTIAENPGDADFPSFIIANWHVFDSSLTHANLQAEAIKHKIGWQFEEISSSWYQARGDKGDSMGLGSLVTIDSGESSFSTGIISSYYDGTAHGMPNTVNVTPICFQAKEQPPGTLSWPCWENLEEWDQDTLLVTTCASEDYDWTINGFDDRDYGPPADNASWADFYISAKTYSSTLNRKHQVRHSGTWYLFVSASDQTGVTPGSDSTVWRAYGGNWSAGSYNQGDWVLYTTNDNVYVVNKSGGTSNIPTHSDWTLLGNRLPLIENTTDTCAGDCVGEIHTPKGYEIVAATTIPAADNDEVKLDCVDITITDN